MAVLWQQHRSGTHHEVRTAGRTVRLYTNGVLHSQHNPARCFTGSIWDLLSLPALLPATAPRRILLLGLGGGTIVHQLHTLIAPAHIDAIELDATHIRIAKKFFGVRQAQASIHHVDALQWLRDYRAAPYDMIIDDLFIEQDRQPQRLVKPSLAWFKQLSRLLSPGGMLVFNHADAKEFRQNAWLQSRILQRDFPFASCLQTTLYENRIGVFLRTVPPGAPAARLRQQVSSIVADLPRGQIPPQFRLQLLKKTTG